MLTCPVRADNNLITSILSPVTKTLLNLETNLELLINTGTGKQSYAQDGCLVVSCANIAIKDYVQLTTVAGHLLGDNHIGSFVIYSETFLIFVAFGP